MTGIHILLFPSSNPVKNSQYTDVSYIFFDAFSTYLKTASSRNPEIVQKVCTPVKIERTGIHK